MGPELVICDTRFQSIIDFVLHQKIKNNEWNQEGRKENKNRDDPNITARWPFALRSYCHLCAHSYFLAVKESSSLTGQAAMPF